MKKLFFISFVIFIFISCNKENEISNANYFEKKQLTISKISEKEFEINSKAKSYLLKAESILKKKQKTKNLHDTINHLTIITDSITYIERNDYHSYTFDIILDNPNPFQKNTLLLSTNPDSTYLSLILTYQYDNNYNLINYYYEDVIDSNIFETYKTEPKVCWCCDLTDNMLRIVYGCEASSGDGDDDSDDNNNYDDGGNNFNNNDDYQDTNPNPHGSGDEMNGPGGSTNSDSGSSGSSHYTQTPDITAVDEIISIITNPTQETLIWLYNPANYQIVQTLINYLQANGNSQQAQEFVNLITSNQINDLSNINFDDCIIITNRLSNNYPFFKNVFQEVDALSSNIIETSRSVFDSDMNTSIVVDAIDFTDSIIQNQYNFSPDAAADTRPNTPGSQNLFNIYFNTNTLDECTDIYAVVTYIHEQIHAILLYASATNQISVTNLNDASFEDLLEAYAAYIQTHDSTYNGQTHHNIIVNFYLNEIANAIQEWGNNNGYNLSTNYCQKIAWTGLLNTTYFTTLYYDNNGILTNEGVDILGAIIAEQNNTVFTGINGITYYPIGSRP